MGVIWWRVWVRGDDGGWGHRASVIGRRMLRSRYGTHPGAACGGLTRRSRSNSREGSSGAPPAVLLGAWAFFSAAHGPGCHRGGGNGGEPPGSGGACGNWEAFPAQAVNALLCAAQCTLPAGPVFVIAAAVSGALPAGARQKPLCPTMAAAVRRCPPRAFERRKRSSGCARLTGW